jgi:hypothetical protein
MKLLPAGLILLLASAASAHPHGAYRLAPTDGSAKGYVVTADHAPSFTPNGTASIPPGTTLTVESDGWRRFEVFVVGPTALDSSWQKGKWTGTLTQPGGYKVQFGDRGDAYFTQVDLVVNP